MVTKRATSNETLKDRRLKLGERPLDAVEKGGLEVDPVTEIAQQVGDREAAGFLEEPPRSERAGRVRQLRLAAGSTFDQSARPFSRAISVVVCGFETCHKMRLRYVVSGFRALSIST